MLLFAKEAVQHTFDGLAGRLLIGRGVVAQHLVNQGASGLTFDILLVETDSRVSQAALDVEADNGLATTIGNVTDGAVHSCRSRWIDDSLVSSKDGVDGNEDDSVDVPDDLVRLFIGQNVSGSKFLRGLLANFRIYKKVVASGG